MEHPVGHYVWFKWPLIGRGIGVVFHGWSVFVFTGGSRITEKMIETEIKKKIQSDSNSGRL